MSTNSLNYFQAVTGGEGTRFSRGTESSRVGLAPKCPPILVCPLTKFNYNVFYPIERTNSDFQPTHLIYDNEHLLIISVLCILANSLNPI